MAAEPKAPVFRVDRLTKHFGTVAALDDINFEIAEGEILAVVGESGSGKSTLARTILRLLDASSGAVIYRGKNLLALPKREMRAMRQHLQMIFQDPYASLHPRRTVAELISEPWRVHKAVLAQREWPDRVRELLAQVGLPESYAGYYPARLSGGERQRVAIARAVVGRPALLLCDEPTGNLDSVTSESILELFDELSASGLTIVVITHDGRVSERAARRVRIVDGELRSVA